MRPVQCRSYLCLYQDQNLALMPTSRIGERAHLNLVSRHTGLHQSVADGIRAVVTQVAVLLIGASHGAIDSDFKRRILHQVSGDVGNCVHAKSRNVHRRGIEVDFLIRGPKLDGANRALGACRSHFALFALEAGRASIASDASQASITCLSTSSLHPGKTGYAGPSGRANKVRALRTRGAENALLTGGASRTSGTRRTREALTSSPSRTNLTFSACGTDRTCVSASANDDATWGACRSDIALRAAWA